MGTLNKLYLKTFWVCYHSHFLLLLLDRNKTPRVTRSNKPYKRRKGNPILTIKQHTPSRPSHAIPHSLLYSSPNQVGKFENPVSRKVDYMRPTSMEKTGGGPAAVVAQQISQVGGWHFGKANRIWHLSNQKEDEVVVALVHVTQQTLVGFVEKQGTTALKQGTTALQCNILHPT